ncbi:MAG: dihydrolipoyl dehydrogenase family protein [Acidimicrobiia bacterium]
MTKVDTIVVGAGMAGIPMALRAARNGPTVLIEPDQVGGTCLNRGCIPTKTMLHSAKVAHLARRSADFGVHVGDVRVDLGEVVDRKDGVVRSVRDPSYRAIERAEDLELVEGWARFLSPREVAVNGSRWETERVIINNGARPSVPAIPGLDQVPRLDSTSALDLRELPDHLIVIGGGYVGCEFAQMFRRFDAQVTLIQRADRLLPAEDSEVSQVVHQAFEREGIAVRINSSPEKIERSEDGVVVWVGEDQMRGSHLLIATGRTPNSDSLDVAAAGIEVDDRGFIQVDGNYSTSQAGIYAIGDAIGPPMFTHSARDDAFLVYQHVYRGRDVSWEHRLVPHAVFTDPEVASFGLGESQARELHGDRVAVGTERFRGVAKARAIGETDGFVKIVAGPDREILGATIVGPDAGNLIHELVVAAAGGLKVDTVRGAIHIHPTLAEAVNSAAGGVHHPTMAE